MQGGVCANVLGWEQQGILVLWDLKFIQLGWEWGLFSKKKRMPKNAKLHSSFKRMNSEECKIRCES